MAAKKLLHDMDMSYENIDIEQENISRDDLANLTGGYTVPQIVINDKPIGGFEHLMELNQSGKLEELINL